MSSCCAAMHSRADVMGSAQLWGHLCLGKWDAATERKLHSLAAWLARRDGGVVQLRLVSSWLHWQHLGPGGGLRLPRAHEPRWDCDVHSLLRVLPAAPSLPRLELRDLGLRKLPPQL